MPPKKLPGLLLRILLLPLLLPALPARAADKVGSLTPASNLALGRFIAAGGGTVVVSPGGVRSTSGVIPLPGGTISAAAFNRTESGNGKSLRWTTITLPSSATLSSGSASMTLNAFTSNPVGTFNGSNLTQLNVGATLNVSPNQPAGTYTGTFSVTVNYE
ncbi:MAG: DUF4402 domain-containing protein [Telluria sp.]